MRSSIAVLYFMSGILVACEGSQASTAKARASAETPMQSPFIETQPTTEPPGYIFEHALFSLQVKDVQACKVDEAFSKKQQPNLITVRVEMTNRGKAGLYLNPLAFEINRNDQHFRPTLGACGASFETGYLEPQKMRSGSLTFSLPAEAKPPWVMHFRPFIVGSPAIDAQVQLHAPRP